MSFNLNTPYSLYSIPVIYATAFYPHVVKFRLIDKTVGFVNLFPRENERQTLQKKGAPPEVIDKIVKLGGAHTNGNETFTLWAAAVLAANFAGVDQHTLNKASGAFILLRLLYNYLYINAKSETAAWGRSATFVAGIGIPMFLLVKAGNKLCAASGF